MHNKNVHSLVYFWGNYGVPLTTQRLGEENVNIPIAPKLLNPPHLPTFLLVREAIECVRGTRRVSGFSICFMGLQGFRIEAE